jgi:hypothetical protein
MQFVYSADSKIVGNQKTEIVDVGSKNLSTFNISKNDEINNKSNVQLVSNLTSPDETIDVVICTRIYVSCLNAFTFRCDTFINLVAMWITFEESFCGELPQ